MTIQVLGRGCGRCEVLHVNTVAAVSELGLAVPSVKLVRKLLADALG